MEKAGRQGGWRGGAKTSSRTKHPINHEELLKYQNK